MLLMDSEISNYSNSHSYRNSRSRKYYDDGSISYPLVDEEELKELRVTLNFQEKQIKEEDIKNTKRNNKKKSKNKNTNCITIFGKQMLWNYNKTNIE